MSTKASRTPNSMRRSKQLDFSVLPCGWSRVVQRTDASPSTITERQSREVLLVGLVGISDGRNDGDGGRDMNTPGKLGGLQSLLSVPSCWTDEH